MAMEIIDGHAGKPHISGEDLAALNIGTFGEGDYVLAFGNQLAATMTTSNQVTIGTGALVQAGRRAVNLSSETLTVQSGTQGQKRNDLVVARYAREGGTNVESIALAVVKGTPVSYGEAADPDVTDDEMKLWRIPINGITPGTPVQLFETIPSIDALRDSVSHRFEHGVVVSGDIAPGSIQKVRVDFSEPFEEPPTVVASISSGSGTADAGMRLNCQPYSVEEGGFMLAIYNSRSTTASTVSASWVAVS